MSDSTPETEIQRADLELDDIENLVRIIDYASDQGAFKGWGVIRQVIDVRDRVNDFVVSARALQAASAGPGETPAAPAEGV